MTDSRVATAYLVIGRNAQITRMTKSRPRLEAGQIAVRVAITIPMTLFDAFIPQLNVTLAEPNIIMPSIELIEAPQEEEDALPDI